MKLSVKESLAALCIVATAFGTICAQGAGNDSRLNVMSFNVRFDTPKDTGNLDWSKRQIPIANMLAEIEPDIIGAQEVTSSMASDFFALAPQYGHFAQEPVLNDPDKDKMRGNNAILYRRDRFEPLDSGYFWLSETPETASRPWDSTDRHYRTAVWLKLHPFA